MRWSDISFSPTTLRQFAALWIVFFGALAGWYGLHHEQHTAGIVLFALAITIGPLGLWRPALIRPIYTFWMAAVFPIGWLTSNLMLAAVYFGIITPIALLFRIMKRDPLQRRPCPEAATYWQVKSEPNDMGRYLRQY